MNIRFVRMLVVALGGAALLPAATDDPEEISTDRPDFTESTDTISPGSMQLEAGFLFSRHALASGPSRELGAPYSLLRIGFNSFAEIRIGADGFTSESRLVNGSWDRHEGASDLEITSKVRLWKEKVHIPAFAFIAGLSIPTGNAYFSSGRPDPLLELCWSKSLPLGFDAGGNVNFRWNAQETEHAVSLSVGHKLGRLGYNAYGEIYRLWPISGDEPVHWIANTGITKQLGSHWQVDAEIGHTVDARTPYWFAGVGFAIHVPTPAFVNTLLHSFH